MRLERVDFQNDFLAAFPHPIGNYLSGEIFFVLEFRKVFNDLF